jgi:hypothetical protein
MTSLKKKNLFIDSKNALTANNNIWVAPLDIDFEIESYDRITLVQAQIPVSFFTVSSDSNKFTLTEGNVSTTISVQVGNYNIISWQKVIPALLSSNSPNGLTYTCTYVNQYTTPDLGLFTYTVNSSVIPVSFSFLPNNYVYAQFGFYPSTTNSFSGGILKSSCAVNFQPETSLFIHCSVCDSESTAEYSDVLHTIYSADIQPLSNIVFVNPDPVATSKKLKNKDKNIVFSLTDENNLPINLSGGNLLVQVMIFKEDNTNQTIKNYIDMRNKLFIADEETNSKKEIEYANAKRLDDEVNAKRDQVMFDILNKQSTIMSEMSNSINLLLQEIQKLNSNMTINKNATTPKEEITQSNSTLEN